MTTGLSGRFTPFDVALHWAVAVLVTFELLFTLLTKAFPQSMRGKLIGLHVSFGMCVLGLAVICVLWRLVHRPPALPARSPRAELTARAVSVALYFFIIAVAFSGYARISAHPLTPRSGARMFGELFIIPPVGWVARLENPLQKHVHDRLAELHLIGSWLLLALLVIHIALLLQSRRSRGVVVTASRPSL